MGDAVGAYEALRAAVELESDTEGVLRELGGVCLVLGESESTTEGLSLRSICCQVATDLPRGAARGGHDRG